MICRKRRRRLLPLAREPRPVQQLRLAPSAKHLQQQARQALPRRPRVLEAWQSNLLMRVRVRVKSTVRRRRSRRKRKRRLQKKRRCVAVNHSNMRLPVIIHRLTS